MKSSTCLQFFLLKLRGIRKFKKVLHLLLIASCISIIIVRGGPVVWPVRSHDLESLEFFVGHSINLNNETSLEKIKERANNGRRNYEEISFVRQTVCIN